MKKFLIYAISLTLFILILTRFHFSFAKALQADYKVDLQNQIKKEPASIVTSIPPTIPKRNTFNFTEESLSKLKAMPYNDEIFNLTFNTLVYNSNINAAYELASIAVAKKPDDFTWHKRLAQTATWVGEFNIAMPQWLYVVQHTKDKHTIEYAMSIAKVLGYDPVLAKMLEIYISYYPDNAQSYVDLASAQNSSGEPLSALSTLERITRKQPMLAAYELNARIYEDQGQLDAAIKAWQKVDNLFGPNIKSVMAQAEIYYNRAQFEKALNILKKGIPVAKKTDQEFWLTLADLAWLVNNRQLAILGYSHDISSPSTVIQLIELELSDNPKMALHYSVLGWKKFHQLRFFSDTLVLAQQHNQWDLINDLFIQLSSKELNMVQNTLPFWQVQAGFFAALGADTEERDLLYKGVILHPEMIQLKSDLLWVVMSNGEYIRIKTLMEAWFDAKIWQNDLLWHAFAEGFDVLNKYYPAILMYQDRLPTNQDGQIFVDYADLLDRATLFQQAYDVRCFLWYKTLYQMHQHHIITDKRSLQTLSQIAPHFVSGSEQVQFFNSMIESDMNGDDINILLNWIVPRNYYDLMTYFKTYYMNGHLPDWAEINLALIKNDLTSLQKIIEHRDRQWPRADRINAAVRLENIPRALNFAFDELNDRPLASEIYSEFVQYGLMEANYFNIGEEYEQFVNLVGPRTKLEARLRLDNTWKIKPYINWWHVRSNKNNTLTNVPPQDLQIGFKLNQKIHRGNIVYTLGYRNALDGFITAAIDLYYQLAARWLGNAKIGYNQEVYESAPMRIGGVQDQINLGFIYSITKYDSLLADIQLLKYYSQDRHYLGDGCNLNASFLRKIWLDYPDFTVGPFGSLHHFNRNGSYGGDVTNLFPPLLPSEQTPELIAQNQAANYKQLIPNDYGEAGFVFSFGDYIPEYSHCWRPYLWSRVFYNTLTHMSYNFIGGVNTSVFGRDSLLFYAEYGTSPTTANAVNYILGVRYLIYF